MHHSLVRVGIVCGILLFLFAPVGLLTMRAVPAHELIMLRFERAFARIDHPDGAELIQRYTHFGDGSVSGSGYEACHYYVAEARSIPGSFERVTQYYESHIPHLSGEFSDVSINVLPMSEASLIFGLDFPLVEWIEEYRESSGTDAYIVYSKRIDENVAGDFRCWVI